jgi:hypothetical protein
MNSNKNTIFAIVALFAIAALVYSVWLAVIKPTPQTSGTGGDGVLCTMDAMQCSDGSWVGRSGPDCQFVCPIPATSSADKGAVTVEARLNQKVIAIAEGITPLEVIEDSRCAIDVQCIQAGTVRVRVRIEGGMGTATETFSLNGTITTETEAITLVAVRPENESGKQIASKDYRFVFRVSKR